MNMDPSFERFELLSGVDGGVVVWDKLTEEVIDAYSPDEALRYFSREQVEAAQANPSPAKLLSFHPAHTCSNCGHVTVPEPAQTLPLDVRLALGLLGHREHQDK